MKKIKSQNHTKVAIFAGAAALMALTPQTHAQSAVDALLNKLEQKGILSVDEAKELKAENSQDTATDFNKALGSKFPMSDWVTSYRLYGDFRGRVDDVSTDIPAFATPGSGVPKKEDNNLRLRYRVRVGLTVNMKDDLQVGFRLGSADLGSGSDAGTGTPFSNNTTLAGNGSKKLIWVDAAYGKWTPINNGTWMVAGTIGKMDQPFQVSPMVFDPDYTPEGAALQATYKINDRHSLAFNGAAFVLDQTTSRGPFLFGGQMIWNATWSPKIATSLGVAAYDIADDANFPPGTTVGISTPYDSNLGNTIQPVTIPSFPATTTGYTFASRFNPVVASGSVTYTLDSFPLYKGAFPVRFAGEFMNNPAAAHNNTGWWVGATLGKSGKKGTWDISYRYQRLEADAWWDQIVDDDNIAVTPATPATLPVESGFATGGTNIKGHMIKFNYSIYDSLTFSFTAYINELINNPVPNAQTGAVHAMADLMWKF